MQQRADSASLGVREVSNRGIHPEIVLARQDALDVAREEKQAAIGHVNSLRNELEKLNTALAQANREWELRQALGNQPLSVLQVSITTDSRAALEAQLRSQLWAFAEKLREAAILNEQAVAIANALGTWEVDGVEIWSSLRVVPGSAFVLWMKRAIQAGLASSNDADE
jgi:hypothetical protein